VGSRRRQTHCAHWPEVYRKIAAAGKKIQIINGGLDAVAAVIEQIGAHKGVQVRVAERTARNGAHASRQGWRALALYNAQMLRSIAEPFDTR
jgi:hypothetical protein